MGIIDLSPFASNYAASAGVFSQSRFLAWAGKRAREPQRHLIWLAVFSCGQPRVQIRSARFAETVEHEPCGFLCDADLLAQLQRANSLARGDEQVHRVNPLVQRDFGCAEYRPVSDCEGELIARAATIGAICTRCHAVA